MEGKEQTIDALQKSIRKINGQIVGTSDIKTMLSTNEKLFLLCGLIMSGITADGIKPLEDDDFTGDDDGALIIKRVREVLKKRGMPSEKVDVVIGYLSPVFSKRVLLSSSNGESIIESLYRIVQTDILPLLEGGGSFDFAGNILNAFDNFEGLDGDALNDVVLTPRYVASLMARITRTNMNSFVLDTCAGSSGFAMSALEIMEEDAKRQITDIQKLEEKIEHIKQSQVLSIEKNACIFVLSVLNTVIIGGNFSRVVCGDSHDEVKKLHENDTGNYPANVFLLNPPYSAPGKGLVFVDEAFEQMDNGYGAVLIQENAGCGQGEPYAKHILKNNTLLASIHMPTNLFCGKASVQTAIYLFQVGRPHEPDDIVVFVDFSNDGYIRKNKKRAGENVNTRNADHALERYDELADICLGNKPQTGFYTEENGLLIHDTITLNGDDWTFGQHRKINITPTEDDFRKVVSDYMLWKIKEIMKGGISA